MLPTPATRGLAAARRVRTSSSARRPSTARASMDVSDQRELPHEGAALPPGTFADMGGQRRSAAASITAALRMADRVTHCPHAPRRRRPLASSAIRSPPSRKRSARAGTSNTRRRHAGAACAPYRPYSVNVTSGDGPVPSLSPQRRGRLGGLGGGALPAHQRRSRRLASLRRVHLAVAGAASSPRGRGPELAHLAPVAP